MKKMNLNPLSLDKQTIAQLDILQLNDVTGGVGIHASSNGGTSTGCGTGSSQCRAAIAN